MALELRLTRSDAAPWGFRLVGGAEHGLPLMVAKVATDSAAERAGLADGDRLLSIGRQPVGDMSHEGAHRLLSQAADQLHLGIARGQKQTAPSSAPGFEPIPTTNTVPPSLPPEVSSVNRSLNASPFITPVKPYRPFSTEPLDGIPPIEKPIILSPFYHDDFSRIKHKDFETPTKFKLEISKDYLPEGKTRSSNEYSCYNSEVMNEMSVTESYSKVLTSTEELTPLEELNKEIDLQQIEDTAAFLVDESLCKAVTVSEEIKQEIACEITKVESKSSTEITKIISEISSDSSKVSASLLAQLIDKTADEICKSNETKTSVFQEIAFENDDNIDTTRIGEFKLNSKSTTDSVKSNEAMEQKVIQTTDITKLDTSEQNIVESAQKEINTQEILTNENKTESSQSLKNIEHNSILENVKSEILEESSQNKETEHISVDKQFAQSETINQNLENRKERIIDGLQSSQGTELSQSRNSVIEGSAKSLTEIKQHAISTANLLAEQRAYTLGLQTIPNIQGHVQSSYHYDLLLKTFFIHLTDVMVALSRLIMAEGTSRSNSPMPPHKRDDEKQRLSRDIQTENSVQTRTETQHHNVLTQEGLQISESSLEETKKMSTAKYAHLNSLKTKGMTQKMDAVISEFRKNVNIEDEKSEEHIEVACAVRGRSVIEEEVLKENDPLDWLAKKDDSKFSPTQDLVNIESKETDIQNKIMYVATVEEHHISKLDEISTENEFTAQETALNTSEMVESKEKESMHNTISQESTNFTDQVLLSETSMTSEISKCSLAQEATQSFTEATNNSLVSQEFSSEHSTLVCQVKRQSISCENTNIIAEHSEDTTTCKTELKQEQSTTIAENFTQDSQIISEERRASIQNEPTRSESRKPSVIELNGCPESEPVRKLELNTQISVKSDESNNPDAVVPPTPLTDEYIFRLQIHLDESRSKSTTPIREPTPPEPVAHEDPYTVKKPKLIPHVDITIESVKYYNNPKKDLESFGTNGKNGLPGTPDTVAQNINGSFANTETNAFPTTIDQIPHIAGGHTDKSAFPGTIYKIPAGSVDENAVPGKTPASPATAYSDNDNNALPSTVDKNAFAADKNSTETDRILEGIKNNADSCTSISHALTKITNETTNITSASNTAAFSSATNIGVMASAPASASIPVEDFPDTLAEERRRSSILTSAIDDTIKNIELYKKEVGMEVACNEIAENDRRLSQSNGTLYQNGDDWSNVNGASQNGYGCNGYGAAGLGGTTRGIVDALENGGMMDEEMAKELGKPGLTEEKIAELMSGESEMLKEAHVIGLKRVIASHMNRLTDDDDSSVDFQKIKPTISTLRDSEVLKALNEELTKTKEERKKEERKWTTFLQRPARDVPHSRFGYVAPEIEGEPYKIKIVKQPKPRVAPDYKPQPQDFETGPLPWEVRAAREPPPQPARPEDPILVPEAGPQYLEALDNLPESEVPDLEDTGIVLPPPPAELPEQPQPEATLDPAEKEEKVIEEEKEPAEEQENSEPADEQEMEQNRIAQQILEGIQSMVDPSASMEQQLMQMRAQLAALAQLPGVIHQTLELVTSQLGQLTRTAEESKREGSTVEHRGATVTELQEEQISSSEVVTESVVEEAQMSIQAVSQAEQAQQCAVEVEESQQCAVEVEKPQQCAAQPAQIRPEPEETGRPTRIEATLDEQGQVEKQKKELMSELQVEQKQRQVKQRPKPVFGPLVPQERPLVLPGGRRWRSGKDAFNEDFIKETLTAQAELIQGKAKGCQYESVRLPFDDRVNFMKFEKPPKTMDYLKDSDVYKLVHNMDSAPGHQVDRLRPLVIAESEYREKCRSVTPCFDRPEPLTRHTDIPQQLQP